MILFNSPGAVWSMMSALRTELADLKIVNEEQKSQLLVKDGELADM